MLLEYSATINATTLTLLLLLVCVSFSAMCNWQVVGVQVEQNRCKDRALRKAVSLGSPRTGVIAHVHPETSITELYSDVNRTQQ